jgi:cardiolipin synthase
MILRYIPNALTLTRLALIAPFLVFLYQQQYLGAFYIFLLAGFTDALDGWLARSFHCQSAFGSFVDPIADKLLIATSMISLALIGSIPWWLVMLVFLRDITISVGVLAWLFLIQQKPDFKPTYISKINTVLQLSLVTLCLFELAFFKIGGNWIDSLTLLTTATTIGSYIDYTWTWGKKACANTQVSQ